MLLAGDAVLLDDERLRRNSQSLNGAFMLATASALTVARVEATTFPTSPVVLSYSPHSDRPRHRRLRQLLRRPDYVGDGQAKRPRFTQDHFGRRHAMTIQLDTYCVFRAHRWPMSSIGYGSAFRVLILSPRTD